VQFCCAAAASVALLILSLCRQSSVCFWVGFCLLVFFTSQMFLSKCCRPPMNWKAPRAAGAMAPLCFMLVLLLMGASGREGRGGAAGVGVGGGGMGVVIGLAAPVSHYQSKNVNVAVRAKWAGTSILLEARYEKEEQAP
jgi:hypothetical protein